MKGFSGFGVSPVKQNGERDKPQREPKKIQTEPKKPKKPKRTNFNVSNPPPKPNGNGGTLREVAIAWGMSPNSGGDVKWKLWSYERELGMEMTYGL